MVKHVGWMMVAAGMLLGMPAFGQGGVTDERSAQAPAFDEPDAMNVVQKASIRYGSAERKLAQARKLTAKIAEESDDGKRAKLETKREKAYKGAVSDFREALSYDTKSVQGWAGLGSAYREMGQYQEALLAHVEGMKVDANDQTNFVGWTETAMDALLFGQVTAAHAQFVEENPPFATAMLGVVKTWVAEQRVQPGNVNPADLDRLEAWLTEQAN